MLDWGELQISENMKKEYWLYETEGIPHWLLLQVESVLLVPLPPPSISNEVEHENSEGAEETVVPIAADDGAREESILFDEVFLARF